MASTSLALSSVVLECRSVSQAVTDHKGETSEESVWDEASSCPDDLSASISLLSVMLHSISSRGRDVNRNENSRSDTS